MEDDSKCNTTEKQEKQILDGMLYVTFTVAFSFI
jgi:hypothetical protein